MSSNYGKKCCRVCSVTRKAVHNFKLLLTDGLADLFDIFSGGFKVWIRNY